jgi:hypothetical protein
MTEREQFEDWKATIGPETTSIQDIDDCMWLMAWAAWQARAALSQQAEPALRLKVTVDDSNPLDRHHFECVWLQTPYAAGEYLYYAAPPAVQQAEPVAGTRILLARFINLKRNAPPAIWYEWDGKSRAMQHEYRWCTLDSEDAT